MKANRNNGKNWKKLELKRSEFCKNTFCFDAGIKEQN